VALVTAAVQAAAVRPEVGVYVASLKTDPLGAEATAKTGCAVPPEKDVEM
jgi:hypothetical protein